MTLERGSPEFLASKKVDATTNKTSPRAQGQNREFSTLYNPSTADSNISHNTKRIILGGASQYTSPLTTSAFYSGDRTNFEYGGYGLRPYDPYNGRDSFQHMTAQYSDFQAQRNHSFEQNTTAFGRDRHFETNTYQDYGHRVSSQMAILNHSQNGTEDYADFRHNFTAQQHSPTLSLVPQSHQRATISSPYRVAHPASYKPPLPRSHYRFECFVTSLLRPFLSTLGRRVCHMRSKRFQFRITRTIRALPAAPTSVTPPTWYSASALRFSSKVNVDFFLLVQPFASRTVSALDSRHPSVRAEKKPLTTPPLVLPRSRAESCSPLVLSTGGHERGESCHR